jgi:hypothetical protein
VGALPPSPEQRGKAAPLGKGVKPPYRAGNCRGLESPGGLSRWPLEPPPLSFTNIGFPACSRSPVLVAIDSINEQGEALRLYFEAVVAAVELSVPRGKLKNRIKTFLGNPLCRGADELCTKQLETRQGLFVDCQFFKDALMKSNSENLEYPGYLAEKFELKEENDRLKKENSRQDMLLFYYTQEKKALLYLGEQRESVQMHYNELQSRSAEVEAMQINFEQGLADAVAKARLRAKPGPKKKQNTKGTIGRGINQTTASGFLEKFPSKTQLQKWLRRGVARKTKKKSINGNGVVNRKQLARLYLL